VIHALEQDYFTELGFPVQQVTGEVSCAGIDFHHSIATGALEMGLQVLDNPFGSLGIRQIHVRGHFLLPVEQLLRELAAIASQQLLSGLGAIVGPGQGPTASQGQHISIFLLNKISGNQGKVNFSFVYNQQLFAGVLQHLSITNQLLSKQITAAWLCSLFFGFLDFT